MARNDDPLDSFLVGTRITVRPFSLLEIALGRTAQWGGRGHPQSLDSFLHMLIGRGVNANGAQESVRDPANEVSGFDLRLRCPGGYRCAAQGAALGTELDWIFLDAPLGRWQEARAGVTLRMPL